MIYSPRTALHCLLRDGVVPRAAAAAAGAASAKPPHENVGSDVWRQATVPGAKMRVVGTAGLYSVAPRKASGRASQSVHAPTPEAKRQQMLNTAIEFAAVLEKQLAEQVKIVGCATIVEVTRGQA